MYFIGVTTAQSSINAVFPRWAQQLELGPCALRGVDFPLGAAPERYRAAVEFIKRDPLSLGALITTHKIDLFAACRDLFDELDPLAKSLGEVSSIYKRSARLHGRAVDPWAMGYALEAFFLRECWRHGGDVLILGAGGAGTALVWDLNRAEHGADRPTRVFVGDRSTERLAKLVALHEAWPKRFELLPQLTARSEDADQMVAALAPGSLVVNATGMGKDRPGSPLTSAALFPREGAAWELNYRGELEFLAQARAQADARGLTVTDGWVCFLHGWTRIIADVFDRDIPTTGPVFEELGRIAAATR